MSSLTVDFEDVIDRLETKARKKIRFKVANVLMSCIREASHVAAQNTPAWSGTTLLNYQWTLNRPGRLRIPHPTDWKNYFSHDSAPYGDELAREGLQLRSTIFSNPYVALYLTNNSVYETKDGSKDFGDFDEGDVTGVEYMIMEEVQNKFQEILSRVS
jgi:hypothetical protein